MGLCDRGMYSYFHVKTCINVLKNDHACGDQWNGEDFSIFSQDDLELPEGIASASTSSYYLTHAEDCITEQGKTHNSCVENIVPWKNARSDGDSFKEGVIHKRGYRAAEAYLRPSPIRVKGQLNSYGFDLKRCTFTMAMDAQATDPQSPTEIYLPCFHFAERKVAVTVSEGKWQIIEHEVNNVVIQCLLWWHDEGKAEITVKGKHQRQRRLGIGY